LSTEDLAEIQRKTNAYKEELFVKEYLMQYAVPEPVTTKMVANYYNNNLQQFGGAIVKVVELLNTVRKPSEQQRDQFLSSVNAIKDSRDWKVYAKKESAQLGLVYSKAKVQPGLLDEALESIVQKLAVNEMSDVLFVKGVPTIVRVLDQQQLRAKPLAEVSPDIRKKLAPLQLKKAVRKASEEAVKEAEVIIK
jgi:hypothetical protein